MGVSAVDALALILIMWSMKEIIESATGERWIELSDDEVKMGFLSQCVEQMAEIENCHYIEMLDRLEKANMTQGYILRFYDVLHTQSWENIISDLSTLLHKREI